MCVEWCVITFVSLLCFRSKGQRAESILFQAPFPAPEATPARENQGTRPLCIPLESLSNPCHRGLTRGVKVKFAGNGIWRDAVIGDCDL